MSLDKSALKSALIEWMEKGAANDFSLLVDGVLWFQDVLVDYWKEGQDTYTNKVQSMDAALMVTALLTLAPTETTPIPALQLATGAVGSWAGKTLSTTFFPGDGVSATSNVITATATLSDLQDAFKEIFDLDFNFILDNAPPEIDKSIFLRIELADKWADALETAGVDCTWLLTYVQNIPPVFPPNTATGNIS